MRIVLTLLFFLLVFESIACSCPEVDKRLFRKMWNKADFVMIITPLKTPHPEWIPESEIGIIEYGWDVLVKVEKVLKGNSKSDTTFIAQTGSSCSQTFHFGKRYLVFGKGIKNFRKMNQKEVDSQRYGFNPKTKEMLNDPLLVFEYEFYNKLVRTYTSYYTNTCESFELNSPYFEDNVKKFLRQSEIFEN